MHAAPDHATPEEIVDEIASLLKRYRSLGAQRADDREGRKLRVKLIRLQNDLLRRFGLGGRICITRGVSARGESFVQRALSAVSTFSAFTVDNDPYGEHDFGALDVEAEYLFFKIDAYDKELRLC